MLFNILTWLESIFVGVVSQPSHRLPSFPSLRPAQISQSFLVINYHFAHSAEMPPT